VLDRGALQARPVRKLGETGRGAGHPGADDFMRYALRRGVQVYLVTNRTAS
jgi:predicted secreted acid phosphatase